MKVKQMTLSIKTILTKQIIIVLLLLLHLPNKQVIKQSLTLNSQNIPNFCKNINQHKNKLLSNKPFDN